MLGEVPPSLKKKQREACPDVDACVRPDVDVLDVTYTLGTKLPVLDLDDPAHEVMRGLYTIKWIDRPTRGSGVASLPRRLPYTVVRRRLPYTVGLSCVI